MIIVIKGKAKFNTAAILKRAHELARDLVSRSTNKPYAKALKWAMRKAWVEAREAVFDLGITNDNGTLLGYCEAPQALVDWVAAPPKYASL